MRLLLIGSDTGPACSPVSWISRRHVLDRQVADNVELAALSRGDLLRDKGDVRVRLDVEEVAGLEVTVATGFAGAEAGTSMVAWMLDCSGLASSMARLASATFMSPRMNDTPRCRTLKETCVCALSMFQAMMLAPREAALAVEGFFE